MPRTLEAAVQGQRLEGGNGDKKDRSTHKRRRLFKQKLNTTTAASHLENVINPVSRLAALVQVSPRQRLLGQCHRGYRSIGVVDLRDHGHGHVRVRVHHAWRRGAAGLT